MFKFRFSLKVFTSVLFGFALVMPVSAEDTGELSGRDLLNAVRQTQGREKRAAYDSRSKPAAKTDKKTAEPNEANTPSPQTISKPAVEIPIDVLAEANEPVTEKTAPETSAKPATKPAEDKLLSIIPSDSLFVLRINNFDYTLGQLDNYLAGLIPIPGGLSMLARMQIAGYLGSPELKGLDTSGSVTIFCVTPKGESSEDNLAMPAVGMLLSVKDYNDFLAGNPNVSQPDANGISTINGAENGKQAFAIKNKDFVLLTDHSENLATLSNTGANKGSLAEAINEQAARLVAREPVWLYVNTQQCAQAIEGLPIPPSMPLQLNQIKIGEVNSTDFQKTLKELRSVDFSLSFRTRPDSIVMGATVYTVPGSETAKLLTADSDFMKQLMEKLNAQKPQPSGANVKEIARLIPSAKRADFVGSYNPLNARTPATAAYQTQGQTEIKANSGVDFAVKCSRDRVRIDIALPKEYILALKAAAEQTPAQTPAGTKPTLQETNNEKIGTQDKKDNN